MAAIIPVICSDGASVFHQPPRRPRLDGILGRTPDPLSPDDVLESESTAVVHNPFSDGSSAFGSHLKVGVVSHVRIGKTLSQ